ncbi:unnamed protein product, partial [marine sediment metagenome]
MKRKYFLIVLFLILAISLPGCGVVTDEEKVRDVIDEYFLAINDQNWDRAKSYCIYESDVYYETCLLEDYIDFLYPSVVTINFQVDIFDIVITGDYASAHIDGVLTIVIDDLSETYDSLGYFYLQRISNNWK